MGRYPKTKRVRLDILKVEWLRPVGAFVKDGKITAGWKCVNKTETAAKGLTAMLKSSTGKGIFAGANDGKIYVSNNSGTELINVYSDGGSSAFAFETRDAVLQLVLISGNTYTSLTGGMATHGVMPVSVCCGVMRKGRLFAADATDPYILRWSGTRGYYDWIEGIAGAGSLALELSGGRILDILDFDDELVVFREQSITRFSVFGNPENFKETETLQTPCIYARTAAILGDSIIFFSSGGLMSYRSGRVTKIEGRISDDLLSPTSAYVHDGRYYFICGTSKSLSRSVIFVYDALNGAYEIIDEPAYFIAHDYISLLAYAEGSVSRLSFADGNVQYEVTADRLNFGTDKRKLLTAVEVNCDGDVAVGVSNGSSEKRFSVNGKRRLNIRGAEFKIVFYGYGGSVRSAAAVAEVVE